MNESVEFTQRQLLKRRLNDVVYYAETAEMFLQYMDEANDLMVDYLSQLPEDVVVNYLNELSTTTFNRAQADRAYQLLKSAYVAMNPESIVGEM